MTVVSVRKCDHCNASKDIGLPYFQIRLAMQQLHGPAVISDVSIEKQEFCSIECLGTFVSLKANGLVTRKDN